MKNMTLAMKGKSALESHGISCEIVNLDPMMTENGCAYGLSFSCSMSDELIRILAKRKIAHGEIIGRKSW